MGTKGDSVFFIFTHLGHVWDTDTGAEGVYKRATRGAKKVTHLGHGWNTGTLAPNVYERGTRCARERYERGTRGVHRLTLLPVCCNFLSWNWNLKISDPANCSRAVIVVQKMKPMPPRACETTNFHEIALLKPFKLYVGHWCIINANYLFVIHCHR